VSVATRRKRLASSSVKQVIMNMCLIIDVTALAAVL